MDEGDTCRICRTGAEDDARLYHPCKCSGSIAKVHQDCLIEWLQHSKKKSCELCNTELRFHKLYSTSMPTNLPLHLYLRRLILQTFVYVRLSLRALLVAVAWLAILPLGNIYIWRGHFLIVDILVWALTGSGSQTLSAHTDILADGQNHTSSISPVVATNHTAINSTNLNGTKIDLTAVPFIVRPFRRILVHVVGTTDYRLFFGKVAHDIFEGQMLTCALVVLFVALFLLREWCLQNLPQPVDGLQFAPAPQVQEQIEPEPVAQIVPSDRIRAEGAAEAERREQNHLRQEESLDPSIGASELKVSSPDSGQDFDDFVSVDDLRARRAHWMDNQFQRDSEVRNANQSPSTDMLRDTSPEDASSSGVEKGKGRMLWPAKFDGDEVEEKEASEPASGKGKEKSGESVDLSVVEADRHELPVLAGRVSNADHGSDTSDSANVDDDDMERLDEEDQNFEDDDHEVLLDLQPGAIEDAHAAIANGNADGMPAVDAGFEGQRNGMVANGELDDAGDWEDELENGERLEDDLEGMMEAIGMRGPFANLITNMTMMFVLCSFILTVFVALPYMLGRLLGVGHSVARLMHQIMRGCRFAFQPVRTFARMQTSGVLQRLGDQIYAYGPTRPGPKAHIAGSAGSGVVTRISSLFRLVHRQELQSSHLSSKQALRLTILSCWTNIRQMAKSGQVRSVEVIHQLHLRTRGSSPLDRAFCIGLGHSYWLVGLAIQSRLSHLYIRWNLRSLKSFVDQQLVVLKVLAFILLELVIFPLGCGILTDISLFPLWDGVTISSRLQLLRSRPLSVSFTLWSLGTLYMFALAQFVSHTRSIVRPGVLCFIRDAGDPNFHPIKDILERRSLEQLRKIGISAIIYSSILFLTLGLCSRLVAFSTTGVLPLKWQAHRAWSSTGLELGCIATLLPLAVRTWFPSHLVRRFTRRWWKFIAHKLRISAFLVGSRLPDEEGSLHWPTWNTWLWGQLSALGLTYPPSEAENGARVTFKASGGYARVPADDLAVMTSPLLIRTNSKGVALNERGAEAIRTQEEAIAKLAKKPQYTVLYVPPHFRLRIIALIVSLWCTICALILTGFLPPLLVGRSTLTVVGVQSNDAPVHDAYAWFIGCAVIGSSHTLGAKAQRMYLKLRTSSNPLRRFGKHVHRFAQRTLFVTLFGLITSTTLAMCVETYMNGLTRFLVGHPRMPPLSLLHVWSMGLMEQQLGFEIVREAFGRTFRPDMDAEAFNLALRPMMALLELQNGGWRRPKAVMLVRRAFLPTVAVHLASIVAPFTILRGLRAVHVQASDRARSVQTSLVFLLCLLYISSGLIGRLIANRMDSWTDVIKDEHFLISTELKDYESAEEAGLRDGVNADDHLNAEGPIPDALLHAGE